MTPVRIGSVSKNLTLRLLGSVFFFRFGSPVPVPEVLRFLIAQGYSHSLL